MIRPLITSTRPLIIARDASGGPLIPVTRLAWLIAVTRHLSREPRA